MNDPIHGDDFENLERLSVDELERPVTPPDLWRRDDPMMFAPPSRLERAQRCDSSQRELLRHSLRFDVG